MKHLLIDGLNFFIRAFTANPAMCTNGEHIGGCLGFLLGMNKLIRENNPDNVIVIWDGEGGSVKRRSLFKDYKAGRTPRLNREYDMEDKDSQLASFRKQLSMLDTYFESIPITSIKVKGIEADDIIAYLCNFIIDKNEKKLIVSSDKDFYQLLDENTMIYIPTQKKYFTSLDLVEKLSILPENYIYMKALCGDKSDNIDGIKGIGPKTTLKLFPFLGDHHIDIEELFEYADKNSKTNNKYESVIKARKLIIGNIDLMQLTDPLMNPLAAKSIRVKVSEKKFVYKPTEIKMQLFRDGIQLKAHDFFFILKELHHRVNKRS